MLQRQDVVTWWFSSHCAFANKRWIPDSQWRNGMWECSARSQYNYRPQRSCGKVLFSQACVKNSVQGGHALGVCMGACMAGGHAWQLGMWGGVRGMHGRRNGNCSGRYASYRNAFLFILFSNYARSK